MHIAHEVPPLLEIFEFLTQWYRTKLRAIVPNANYFKPIILKFKILIYNSDSKIMFNFCIYGGNIPPVGGGRRNSSGGEIFYREYFQIERLKIRKTNG